MREIIDFHTHVFPDPVAAQAIPALEKIGGVKACHDGRLVSLLAKMDEAGIEKSVICSIATRPAQFASILDWSKAIRSARIIPFPSFHPAAADALEQIATIRAEGFLGIKMHPYYQGFALDEERMLPLYEKIAELGLILVMHTGYDIGFPRERIADPRRIMAVLARIPPLKLVAAHFGAWDEWEAVEAMMLGHPVHMDLSYSLHMLPPEKARAMVLVHPEDYILFGTDSPWAEQSEVIARLKELNLGPALEEKILAGNAASLLGTAG
ncbi:amidohydrolase family protein [Thiovibrio sp. JS02]